MTSTGAALLWKMDTIDLRSISRVRRPEKERLHGRHGWLRTDLK
jgi:hypothetical protein